METKRVHVWVSGRVQGVFFRAHVLDGAQKEGVTGWVKNLRDGRVEALFDGESDRVDRMVAWCRVGSPHSRVDEVEVRDEPREGELHRFEVLRTA